jgi:hypothetical protein
VHDRAGLGPRDAFHGLDPRHDELAQIVDGLGLGPHDHVVGPGDVLGGDHPRDACDLGGHGGGLADLGLHQDVGLHHGVPLSS